MTITEWFLAAAERDNPATVLDRRHPDGLAWSVGNLVRPLIHGATYFAEFAAAVNRMGPGDLLLFVDWRGDPDELLTGEPGSEVSAVLERAVRRGVDVRGLIWRSHLDRLAFSARENRHLGEDINAAGGECLLDLRVRPLGSHHQKFVVLRHRDRPDADVAFVGGIDLCHSRRDDARHDGDPQRQPMASAYGPRPPWHDVQLAISGPAVGDVETVFRERWTDPGALTRNPMHRIADLIRRVDSAPRPLPPQLPDPPPAGPHAVQLLRTYPWRWRGYPFAPGGERSVARGYLKVLGRARRLVYLEDQYLWSTEIARMFAAALRAAPELLLIAVLPHYPDQDGRMSRPPNLVGREQALSLLRAAGGDRFACYGLENPAGVPVYVHAKVCVVDDMWASTGSDNVNRRSWTHDSELTAAVWDDTLDHRRPAVLAGAEALAGRVAGRGAGGLAVPEAAGPAGTGWADPEAAGPAGTGWADPGSAGAGPAGAGQRAAEAGGAGQQQARRYARELRLALLREHLDRADGADADLVDPRSAFEACATAARALQHWHDGGRRGPRPPGRIRPLAVKPLPAATRLWATPMYRKIYDPDGRPHGRRWRHSY